MYFPGSSETERHGKLRLGAARPDAGAAISLQVEDAVGNGGRDLVELLLPAVSRLDLQPAGSASCEF